MNENADEIVRGLRYTQKKYENKRLFTGETDVSAMARDAADLIESQQSRIAELEKQLSAKEAVNQAYSATVSLMEIDKSDAIQRAESAEKQLAESRRETRAAVEDLSGICGQIDDDEYLRKAFCIHPGNEDCPSEKENGYVDVDDCVGCPLFENSWRGPQAGKGEAV